MNTDTKRNEYVTRDAILKLLSDAEIARVSTREAGPPLAEGAEYIDLEHPEQGVRRMHATTRVPTGEMLPRSAVGDQTWFAICSRLAAGSKSP